MRQPSTARLVVGYWWPGGQVPRVCCQWLEWGYIVHSYAILKKPSWEPTMFLAVLPHNARVFSLQKVHQLFIIYSFSLISHFTLIQILHAGWTHTKKASISCLQSLTCEVLPLIPCLPLFYLSVSHGKTSCPTPTTHTYTPPSRTMKDLRFRSTCKLRTELTRVSWMLAEDRDSWSETYGTARSLKINTFRVGSPSSGSHRVTWREPVNTCSHCGLHYRRGTQYLGNLNLL